MAINTDYSASRYETETLPYKLLEILKISAYTLLLIVMMLVTVKLYSYLGRTIVLYASVATSGACLLTYFVVPMDRPNMIIAFKRNLLIYYGILIGAYFLTQNLNGIDASQLGASLGLNAGQTQNNAMQGWLTTAVQFAMFLSPIGFVGMEIKRIFVFWGFGHGHTTKRKRAEQLQKTIIK